VQRILADEGCGADIYSAGELSAALGAGVFARDLIPEHLKREDAPAAEIEPAQPRIAAAG
jgi:diaminopimelate decarboxylase